MQRFVVRKATVAVAAVVLVGSGALAACGDDDGDDVQAYCDLSAELDEQEGPPSDEQLDEISDLAPDEISEEIDFVVDRFNEDGEAAFEDPEVGERFVVIEGFETENCDGGDAS